MGKNVGGTRNRWGEKKRYEKKSVSYCSQGQPCFIYLSIKWVISAQTSAFLSLSISHWVRRVQKTQISSRLEADWSRTEVVATIRTLFPPPSLVSITSWVISLICGIDLAWLPCLFFTALTLWIILFLYCPKQNSPIASLSLCPSLDDWLISVALLPFRILRIPLAIVHLWLGAMATNLWCQLL